jgi:hypothetical protein
MCGLLRLYLFYTTPLEKLSRWNIYHVLNILMVDCLTVVEFMGIYFLMLSLIKERKSGTLCAGVVHVWFCNLFENLLHVGLPVCFRHSHFLSLVVELAVQSLNRVIRRKCHRLTPYKVRIGLKGCSIQPWAGVHRLYLKKRFLTLDIIEVSDQWGTRNKKHKTDNEIHISWRG